MTTFNYSTGNPTDLTAGANAAMIDLSGPFADLKAFINGANFDTTNLATSAKPVTLLGAYRVERNGYAALVPTTVATTYFPFANGNMAAITGTGAAGLQLWTLTAADYAVSGLTPMMRLRTTWATNATAPAVTFTPQLFAATGVSSAAGQIGISTATGVTSSNAAITTPTASTTGSASSSDFAVPSGTHIVGVAVSGAMAANSIISFSFELQLHYV